MDSLSLYDLSEEEKLENIMQLVLRKHTHVLTQRIIPKRLFPYLKGEMILSPSDCEEIECEKTSESKTDKMLDLLMKKGRVGFVGLVESLLEVENVELVKKLNMSLEEEFQKNFAKVKTEETPVKQRIVQLPRPLPPEFEPVEDDFRKSSSYC